MRQTTIDLLARALASSGSRRLALGAAGALFIGGESVAARRRRDAGQRGSARRTAFSRKCQRFVISAGQDPDDRLRHTDDDLEIKLISRKGGASKTIFNDNNNAPNGPDGDHLIVAPFTARVGDKLHIIARNEVAGGCELDELWLHCIEGRGGKIQLTESISPQECQSDANKIGVFFETKIRIKNK
jgi:hypothetical protein